MIIGIKWYSDDLPLNIVSPEFFTPASTFSTPLVEIVLARVQCEMHFVVPPRELVTETFENTVSAIFFIQMAY
jgi:hypothetical protein